MQLASVTAQMGDDGLRASFMFGDPDNVDLGKNFGADIYFHERESILAALYLRSNGPSFLSSMSLEDVVGLLRRFVMDHYWYLFDETWAKRFEGTYADRVSTATKHRLADAIAKSEIFSPVDELTVYPLVPLTVTCDFDSPTFSLVGPTGLEGDRLPAGVEESLITSKQFPPSAAWTGRKDYPSAWLCVRSPNVKHADKTKSAILGAVALAPIPRYRHMFSGRSNFGGSCTISRGGYTTYFGEPHMPAMMHNIEIREIVRGWLTGLSDILRSTDLKQRRSVKPSSTSTEHGR